MGKSTVTQTINLVLKSPTFVNYFSIGQKYQVTKEVQMIPPITGSFSPDCRRHPADDALDHSAHGRVQGNSDVVWRPLINGIRGQRVKIPEDKLLFYTFVLLL